MAFTYPRVLIISALAVLLPALAHAQDKGKLAYPTKPVRVVVGYAPGGGVDIMGRLISQKITEALGQQVIVDNKPGAGQNIGATPKSVNRW